MAESVQVIPIFIGSPSGLETERRSARGIVDELNRLHARHWGCRLELVGWEETLPGHGRPQELINKDLDRCEYFIGVLYDHWGSPTASGTSQYSSGFEEEYERAKNHVAAGTMKDMAIFFKDIPPERQRDPGPSLKKVFEFREECFARRDALYQAFSDLTSFENLLRSKLSAIGWTTYETRQAEQKPATKITPPGYDNAQTSTSGEGADQLLAAPARSFLSEIIQRSSNWDETSPYDVARLRLIATSIHRSGNDDTVIGAHDANLLFRHRKHTDFSDDEIKELLDCGIQGFDYNNVPLWHWLSEYSKLHRDYDYIGILATVGSEQRQSSAIRLLQLLNQPTPEIGQHFSRQSAIATWMDTDANASVFKNAVSYLTKLGTNDDVELLEKYYAEATSQRKSLIGQAIISIESKNGQAHALERTIELEIDEIDEGLADELFSKPSSLTTELLSRCLSSAANTIRRHAVSILNDRRETTGDMANTLLSDSDFQIRLLAAEALHTIGQPLDKGLAKKALTIVRKSTPFSLLSRSETDTEHYDQYRRNRLAEIDYDSLKKAFDNGSVFDHDEASTLFKVHTRRIKSELRTMLEDDFNSYFSIRMEKFRSEIGTESEAFKSTEALLPFLRIRLLTAAAEALAKLKDQRDLPIFRDTIDKFDIYASDGLLDYLGKFGEWRDIDRIVKLVDPSPSNTNFLLSLVSPITPKKATAIASISRGRIADLLSTDLPIILRRSVLACLSRKEFSELSDEVILQSLALKDDECRAIVALKCCEHLSKARISLLLNSYLDSDEARYYNSIHWLDLGVSMPREVARSIAIEELSRKV